MSQVVIGQLEQDFRIGTQPHLGDVMVEISGDLPEDQTQLLLRRVNALEGRLRVLEAARPSAYWQRFVRRCQRLWARLRDNLGT